MIGYRKPSVIQCAKNPPRLTVASEDNRRRSAWISPEPIEPLRMIEQGDLEALLMKMVRSGQTGQSGAENEDCVRRGLGHENRERSQTRKAITTRWVVVRLIRGPKT